MAKKKQPGHEHHKVTTLDLIKEYLRLKIQKMSNRKNPISNNNISMIDAFPKEQINHIAIILDGRVEEVLRAQNRLAALLLSEPEFVNFDPKEVAVSINDLYVDGNFIKETPME